VCGQYLSIPQLLLRRNLSEEETQKCLSQQKAAIGCIPLYVKRATNFWICAPSGARHVGTGELSDYTTWHDRGWCRTEEAVMLVARSGDGPLHIDGPLDKPPRARCFDVIDKLIVDAQRSAAICTGQFSCCRMDHLMQTHDGAIPCDKTLLHRVLHGLFAERLAALRAVWAADKELPVHEGVMPCLRHSMQGDKAWMHFLFLAHSRPRLLATSLDEPATLGFPADQGWAPVFRKPLERLTRDDMTTVQSEIGLPVAYKRGAASNSTLINLMAGMGALPVLRFLHEKEGEPLAVRDMGGRTALLDACNTGNSSCVEYICRRVPTEHLNLSTNPEGLSPMSVAARCGHVHVLETLLEFGADMHIRRTNGRTPLHEAALAGRVAEARFLLGRGADPRSTDASGETPLDLVLKQGFTCDRYQCLAAELRAAADGVPLDTLMVNTLLV
jgi:hypothetical protein